jgi:hypothetical protein
MQVMFASMSSSIQYVRAGSGSWWICMPPRTLCSGAADLAQKRDQLYSVQERYWTSQHRVIRSWHMIARVYIPDGNPLLMLLGFALDCENSSARLAPRRFVRSSAGSLSSVNVMARSSRWCGKITPNEAP